MADAPKEVAVAMVDLSEEDLFGGDVAGITKVMTNLVDEVEIETESFDDNNMEQMATEMIVDVNKVGKLFIDEYNLVFLSVN